MSSRETGLETEIASCEYGSLYLPALTRSHLLTTSSVAAQVAELKEHVVALRSSVRHIGDWQRDHANEVASIMTRLHGSISQGMGAIMNQTGTVLGRIDAAMRTVTRGLAEQELAINAQRTAIENLVREIEAMCTFLPILRLATNLLTP